LSAVGQPVTLLYSVLDHRLHQRGTAAAAENRIDLKPAEISHTALMSDIENANFQLALDNLYGGPTPYR
jgi:hypothetical protein